MSIYSETIEATGFDPGAINDDMTTIMTEPMEGWFGIRSQTNILRWGYQETRVRAGEISADQVAEVVDDYTGSYQIVTPKSLLGLDDDPEPGTSLDIYAGLPIKIEMVTADAARIQKRNRKIADPTPRFAGLETPTDVYAALADLAPDDTDGMDAQTVHADLDGQTVQAEILPPELTRTRGRNGRYKKEGK